MASVMLPFVIAIAIGAVSAGSPWDNVAPGHISFKQVGICGTGEPAYVGFYNPPSDVLEEKKFWIEFMGGAVCFSKASCNNKSLRWWMSVKMMMIDWLNVPEQMFGYLTSGANIPLGYFAALRPGYMPTDAGHPLYGRRGAFFATCTGDVALGRRNVTYEAVTPENPPRTDCNETLSGEKDSGYRGCQNTTRSGLTCQKWSEQTPTQHDRDWGDHNYCRNNDAVDDTIWCYVTFRTQVSSWDYCTPVGSETELEAYNAKHVGGKSMFDLLTMIKGHYPDLTDFAVFGGSGGGVASAAWSIEIADFFPQAKVVALVDSGLHLMPGTELAQKVYEQAPWGPGPIGQGDGIYMDVKVPDFDWRVRDAIAKHIASFDGRLTIAYLSCMDDEIVYSDRRKMVHYANCDPSTDYLSPQRQHEETWMFLTNLHACSPLGSVYSYIQNCTNHHQTRNSLDDLDLNKVGDLPVKHFVNNVVVGRHPDPNNQQSYKYWYTQPQTENSWSDCPSDTRRRRSNTETSATEQHKGTSTTEQHKGTSATEQHKGTSTTEQHKGTSTMEQQKGTSTTDNTEDVSGSQKSALNAAAGLVLACCLDLTRYA